MTPFSIFLYLLESLEPLGNLCILGGAFQFKKRGNLGIGQKSFSWEKFEIRGGSIESILDIVMENAVHMNGMEDFIGWGTG